MHLHCYDNRLLHGFYVHSSYVHLWWYVCTWVDVWLSRIGLCSCEKKVAGSNPVCSRIFRSSLGPWTKLLTPQNAPRVLDKWAVLRPKALHLFVLVCVSQREAWWDSWKKAFQYTHPHRIKDHFVCIYTAEDYRLSFYRQKETHNHEHLNTPRNFRDRSKNNELCRSLNGYGIFTYTSTPCMWVCVQTYRCQDGLPEKNDAIVPLLPKSSGSPCPIWVVFILQHHVIHLETSRNHDDYSDVDSKCTWPACFSFQCWRLLKKSMYHKLMAWRLHQGLRRVTDFAGTTLLLRVYLLLRRAEYPLLYDKDSRKLPASLINDHPRTSQPLDRTRLLGCNKS